ncbi:hypothetical protein AKJ59_00495 [candidate division MSBL1 archaeon SCGC-AAA385M02]|uniref:Uncharacterized protein n=1 Tax=candidate division MSBL1 archaeon SCGC-AAA385M02 TaxID=1698287 RepID=A0A133VQU6_9EURY|nr:hypothetical protein AKJ59_00495 [candidate division MSBL1 archaeon SCGC-AAA385M02]
MEIDIDCTRVFRLKHHEKGHGVCVGFSNENPPEIPDYDKVHLCILDKENMEKKNCNIKKIASVTESEAVGLGVAIIHAAGFSAAEMEFEEDA